jgi:hypothetical protein
LVLQVNIWSLIWHLTCNIRFAERNSHDYEVFTNHIIFSTKSWFTIPAFNLYTVQEF